MRPALAVGVVLLVLAVGSATVRRTFPFHEAPSANRAVEQLDRIPELDQLRNEGVRLVQDADLSGARRLFQDGLERAKRGGHLRYEALFLTNLGNIDFSLWQYADAMASYLEARRLARRAGDPTLEAILGLNISGVYMTTGALEDAAVSLDEALRVLPAEAPAGYAGALLAQRSFLAARRGNWEMAWRTYEEALRTSDSPDSWALRADILDGFGYELFLAGRRQEAGRLFLDAFRIRQLQSIPFRPHSYRNLGVMFAAAGETGLGLHFLDTAIERALEQPDTTPLWSLYYQRAAVYEQSGHLREAMRDLQRALDVIHRLRSEILPAEFIRRYSNTGLHDVFQRAVAVAVRLYRKTGSQRWIRRAFEIAARGQAVGLAASLGEGERIRKALPPEYWELLRKVAAAETAGPGEGVPASRLTEWRHRLGELEIQAGLRFRAPADQPPASVKQLQSALAPSEACLLFHVAEPASYLWVLTPRTLEMKELPGREKLREAIARFRNAVEAARPEATALGAELYATLFGGEAAESYPDWILAVEDALFELPFSALVIGKPGQTEPTYLIERHAPRLVPSVALLNTPQDGHWQGGLVAVGDPVYNRADPRWPQVLKRLRGGLARRLGTAQLPRLPGTMREIAECIRKWREAGGAAVALTGVEANRAALARVLQQKPAVLHFATHIVAPDRQPKRGFVALSLRPDGRLDLLGGTEIRALACRAELVVLSGCSSGNGEILPGSGLLGLTRAWLRAGTRHVVATLWPVPDGNEALWSRFYETLGPVSEGGFAVPPHRALQAAQVSLIRQRGKRARLTEWAGYFLISTG